MISLARVSFLLLFPAVCAAQSTALRVCPDCRLSSVSEAISQARPHDTVWVEPGTYPESGIRVDKPLTLLGREYPVIDGENKGEIITIFADSVTVSGLQLKNVGTSYTSDYAAIRVVKSEAFTISDNRI